MTRYLYYCFALTLAMLAVALVVALHAPSKQASTFVEEEGKK